MFYLDRCNVAFNEKDVNSRKDDELDKLNSYNLMRLRLGEHNFSSQQVGAFFIRKAVNGRCIS